LKFLGLLVVYYEKCILLNMAGKQIGLAELTRSEVSRSLQIEFPPIIYFI
jgi:hypothetical protein